MYQPTFKLLHNSVEVSSSVLIETENNSLHGGSKRDFTLLNLYFVTEMQYHLFSFILWNLNHCLVKVL